ncbi:MAG: glycosyltransferase [Acidobacteriota bacterium]
MILALAILPFLAWVYLLAFHGRFWRSSPVLPPVAAQADAAVAVVVPARDEAESIQAAVGSLLAQNYCGTLSIVLVDDNSSDGTGDLAAALASGGRLTIVKGEPLPAGWSGKLWAIHQGLSHPLARAADYVLLTDADIVHAPGHIAALVAQAEAGGYELVSEMVRLHCATAAERALIPAFVFFFQMLYPFAWVNDATKRTAGAAGGTMLVARAALDRIDGVSRIRDNLIDDCALAKQIKHSGGRIWLGHAEGTVSTRVYRNWPEVWNMIARTAYVQLGYSPLLLLGCIAGMSLVFCAAPLVTMFAHGVPRVVGAVAWLMSATAFQPTLRRYRRSPFWGLALPAIALFYLGATIASAARHYTGRGGGWKERVYPAAR